MSLVLEDSLEITGRDLRLAWSLPDLVAGDTARPLMRVGPTGSAARVEFTDEGLAEALKERCPGLYRTDPSASGGRLRLVLWSIAAGISVIGLAVYGVPAIAVRLAPVIPAAMEARIGGAVDGQIGRLLGDPPLCDDASARAVLDRLIQRMTANGDLSVDPAVTIRRHGIANALTLPGGRVVVLSELIDKSDTPDEFAGVLAHEFGHVAAHDPMRALLAASGSSFLLSLVLGDLTGSTIIVAVGQAAISAGYSREAENAADAYSVEVMRRSGGDATALATILRRIAKDDAKDEFASLLRSHPYTAERADRIAEMAGTETVGRRILDEAEWATLKGICRNLPAKSVK